MREQGQDLQKEINIKNQNYGPMETDPGPSSGMENDIRPIMETDFSYTYSPIVHGPKWYPTMVRYAPSAWYQVICAVFTAADGGTEQPAEWQYGRDKWSQLCLL